ncbi:MAG: hypothetical protein E7667_01525 [Ruminococcaceae bacterium]|nr:hypothetical protein [Oscillospiraceae bacterium]
MNKKFIIIIAATVFLAIVALCVVIAFVKQDEQSAIDGNPSILQTTPDYGQNYVDNIIFLGDFTSQDMIKCGVLSGQKDSKQVWTGAGGTLALDSKIDKATIIVPETKKEMLISQTLEDRKPRYLVVTLGFENGVPYCTKEAFIQYYEKLILDIKDASPNTKIILQSIFPVTGKFQFKNKAYSNDKIDQCNAWICELADKHQLRFLNTAEVLKTSSGSLITEYANQDGNSLNAKGYAKVIEYIRTHGYTDHPAIKQDVTEQPTDSE